MWSPTHVRMTGTAFVSISVVLQVGPLFSDCCSLATPHRWVWRWPRPSGHMTAVVFQLLLTLLSPTLPATTGPIYHQRQAGRERSDVAVCSIRG